jgi:hypothetical protein
MDESPAEGSMKIRCYDVSDRVVRFDLPGDAQLQSSSDGSKMGAGRSSETETK